MCPKFHQACIAIDGNRNTQTDEHTDRRTHGHKDKRTESSVDYDSIRDIC